MVPTTAPRTAGLLLHPTSLPGPYGIGDLGPSAYAWVDSLARARQRWWQFLPLGPTGYGDSPYQSFSSFAGNTLLLSPEVLAQEGLLSAPPRPQEPFADHLVDYGRIIPFKQQLLQMAWEGFQSGRSAYLRGDFEEFRHRSSAWLNDYTLFMALKDAHDGRPWNEWEPKLVQREPQALRAAADANANKIDMYAFGQFLFFRQWNFLKDYAHLRNIVLIGDVPIFVASDSSDVWASSEFFWLDENRRPTIVAGVPPDYFSATGQLWGNPLYHWENLAKSDYEWWVNRLRAVLELADIVRLDHFRGLAAAWHVDAAEPTAERGQWVPGPGADFLGKLRQGLGALPLIAEDLGVISPDVEELRTSFSLPGMRILQFAFGGDPKDRFLPHNYDQGTVTYTGTHDNDTTLGWFHSAPEHERRNLARYLGREPQDVAWELIRLAWASVADHAVAPVQDLLSLPTSARMNFPGKLGNNWDWRLLPGQLTDHLLFRLAEMTEVYGR